MKNNPSNSEFNNTNDIALRIVELRLDKLRQEEELKISFSGLIEKFDPVQVMKKSLHEIVADKDVKDDLLKLGLNLGTNFIIEKVLGKQSMKEYLNTLLVDKLANSLKNNETLSEILASFSRVMQNDRKTETNT
ncbi:MAG: hypothetical protein KKH44_09165 [Bacteroidetes bacterium]|nr:hypothetical protein [Bacteroidota bacterium]